MAKKSTEIVEISPELQQTLSTAFAPKVSELQILQQSYTAMLTQEMSKELVKEARELRLKIKKCRIDIDKIHSTQKAYFLAGPSCFCTACKYSVASKASGMTVAF